jgi:hypothetical protein
VIRPLLAELLSLTDFFLMEFIVKGERLRSWGGLLCVKVSGATRDKASPDRRGGGRRRWTIVVVVGVWSLEEGLFLCKLVRLEVVVEYTKVYWKHVSPASTSPK